MELHRTPLYKLPVNVLPVNYGITFKPDIGQFRKFDANLAIRVKVLETCNEIMMHAVKLNLKEVEFKTDNNKTFKPEKILHDEENEIVKLFFGQKGVLPVGMATLLIKYDGEISDRELKGVYVNRWNEEERELKDKLWIMTKLDGRQARYAMPCWDDPEFKAIFKMELEIPNEWDALFNTIRESEEQGRESGWKRMIFKETPLMSTSGLAFTIGKFDRAFEKNCDGVKIRVVTPKSFDDIKRRKQWGNWALDNAVKVFDHFNKTYGRDKARYPMEKLDFVVVPNYAVHGTGHFGHIAIREDRFWVNEESSPFTKKQRVVLELAKQIARQWIGNMVNIKDYKQIWLEESLAKYMKYNAIDKIWPEWSIWDQEFTREELMPAMRFDMLPTTDALEITDEMLKAWMGKTSLECMEHLKAGDFDYLEKFARFSKGAAVLRMIKDHIGEMVFDKALFNFFNKNSYKFTSPDELWNEMELESKKPIKQIMRTWTEKKSFPVLHVTGKVDSGTGNYMITLKQEPIFNHLKHLEAMGKMEHNVHKFGDRDEPKNWIIPMSITTDPRGMQHKMDVLMDKEVMSLVIPANDYRASGGYFKIDPKHVAYMVVHYPEDHIRKIIMPMMERRDMRDPMDRFGVLFDLHKLAKIGLYSTTLLFDVLKTIAFSGEDNLGVWRMITECFWEMREMIKDYDYYKNRDELGSKFDRFAQALIRDKRAMLTEDRWWSQSKLEKLKSLDEMLIGLLAHFMVVHKDVDIERKAVDTFWKWYRHEQGNKMVMGDMQKAMFAAAAQTNDMKVLDAFIKIYKEFKFEEAREYVLHGIGFFTDKMIIDKLVNFAMSDVVTSDDTIRMFKSMARRFPMTRDVVWKVLKDKYDYFLKNYDHCRFGTDFFQEFLTNFNDDKIAMDVAKWARDKIERNHCTRMLQQSLEYVQLKNHWFKRDVDMIKKYLEGPALGQY